MKKLNLLVAAFLIFAVAGFSQAPDPNHMPHRWNGTTGLKYILQNIEWTLSYKTLSSGTLTGTTTLSSNTFSGALNMATAASPASITTTPLVTVYTTTSYASTSTVRSMLVNLVQTADTWTSQTEAFRVNVASEYITGDWTNAIVARLDYGTTGDARGGMAAPLCSELNYPGKACAGLGGAYYVLDLEMNCPENFTCGTNLNYPNAWINFGIWGNATAIGSWEDYGFLMRLDGFTDASGNMFYDNTLRMRIGSTSWYIPMSDAEGEYSSAYLIDISNTTDASSTTTGSIQTDGGIGCAKQLYLGDDIDMSESATGTYDITLRDAVADALSIVRGSTDIIVFNTTAPSVTITPATDVVGAFTAGTIASDAGVSGTTGTFTDEIDITKSTAGMAIDANYTATSYTTLVGAVDIRRTGNITGVDTETMIDLNVLPAFTFTEPASGTVYYYGANIDMTSAAVTAGAGTSVIAALALTAGTDADAGTNWALTATGNIDINGYIDLDAAVTTAGGTTGIYSYPYHTTNALTGSLIAIRGSARVDAIDSPSGTVMGGYFQAGNMGTGTDLSIVRGTYTEVVNKIPSGATTWDYARGGEINMDLDQGSAGNVNTITNADGLFVLFNLPTSGSYATVTNGYGIRIVNEAVGGTGQALDAAIYIDDVNMSGGIKGWDYGIDMSAVGAGFTTADIKLSSGAYIQTGTGDPNGSLTGANGSVYIRAGTGNEDTTIYTNTDGGTTWAAADL